MSGKHFVNFVKNSLSFVKALSKYQNIDWYSIVSEEVECSISKKTAIRHPYHLKIVEIGEGTYVAKNCYISLTKIGKFCSIGPNLICGWGIHPLNGVSSNTAFYSTKKQSGYTFSQNDKIEERKQITIGNDVFIGANVTILDGVKIGDGAAIGAGSVVSKDIPAYAIAVGCPIKVIRYRFDPDIIDELNKIKWWDKDEKYHKLVEEYFFDIPSFIKKSKELDGFN